MIRFLLQVTVTADRSLLLSPCGRCSRMSTTDAGCDETSNEDRFWNAGQFRDAINLLDGLSLHQPLCRKVSNQVTSSYKGG